MQQQQQRYASAPGSTVSTARRSTDRIASDNKDILK
jgi:hypothetical protein